MKSDNNKLDFEQMLRTVEHAGRDARRQQELGDMIDRMAAAEERHHGFWWWGARVAAAACLVFFISTAIRVWFIPVDPADGTKVAKVTVAEPLSQVIADSVATTVAVPLKINRQPIQTMSVQPIAEPVESEEIPVVVEEVQPVEEFYAKAHDEEMPAVNTETKPIIAQEEVPAEPVNVAQTIPIEEEVPATPKPERRSLFSSLFCRAEPSMMDGTILAIKIL